MRTFRSIAALGTVLLVVALAAPPAAAKGPRSATIDGPGLDAPIDQPNPGMSKLPDLTGLYGQLWGGLTLVDEPPTTDLGPAYVVTWDLGEYVAEDGRSSGSPDLVRQTVYPYAAGDPLVHTEAGQPFYDDATSGGWYVAHQALRDMLVHLGVPTAAEAEDLPAAALPASTDVDAGSRSAPGAAPADDATANAVTAGAATAEADDDTAAPVADGGGAGWVLPAVVVALGLAVLLVTSIGLVRRRSAGAVPTVDPV